MALFEIATFSALAKLLLAARKLATDSDLLERAKALTDLAQNGSALKAAIKDQGLSQVSVAMEKRAADVDRVITHPGPALDDARSLFQQAVPHALADPSVMAARQLDPQQTAQAMLDAVRASPVARDFFDASFAESYFRQIMEATLGEMLHDVAFIDSIAPDLWRQTLRDNGIQITLLEKVDATTQETKADTAQLLAGQEELKDLLLKTLERTGEATSARESGITDARIVALAREVAQDVADPEQAFRELEAAIEDLKEYRQRRATGTNADAPLADLRNRLEDLANAGKLRQAQTEADAALKAWEAEETDRQALAAQTGIAYLNEAIRRDLDVRDADAAVAKIVRRVKLETPDPAAQFAALRAEQDIWFERGRDKGAALDLHVAVGLAQVTTAQAASADEQGTALNDLGTALWNLKERESVTARWEKAVTAYRAALEEWTRERTLERAPLVWAHAQHNLGFAILMHGEQESGTERLEEAVTAFRAVLEECTWERAPLDWAAAQMNLGRALVTLGDLECGTERPESGTERLEEAVTAFRAALEEWTRERAPLDWARTQMKLGYALGYLEELEEAVTAFRAALEVLTRERVPLGWAKAQNELGNVLLTFGERESGTTRLEEAVTAYRAALKELTRERVPLDWASVQRDFATAQIAFFDKSGDVARLDAAQEALDDARAVYTEAGAEHYLIFFPAIQAGIDRRRDAPA